MNTKDILKELERAFSGYIFHEKFVGELYELLLKDLRGKESKFFKCLTTHLTYIKQLGRRINEVDGHEVLKGFDGNYYSIHIQQKEFNVRFITYISINNIPYFLCAFNERAGKRSTDYSQYISIVQTRYSQLPGGDQNE